MTVIVNVYCIDVAPVLAYVVEYVMGDAESIKQNTSPPSLLVVVFPVIAGNGVSVGVSPDSVQPMVTVRLLFVVAARVIRARHRTRNSPEAVVPMLSDVGEMLAACSVSVVETRRCADVDTSSPMLEKYLIHGSVISPSFGSFSPVRYFWPRGRAMASLIGIGMTAVAT